VGWPGETVEDVAVFDDSVLSTLTPEVARQVMAVREALQDASESRGDEALKGVSVVSRGGALSEWRLFVRGLVDWLASSTESASEAWKRLDPDRRPGRIATVMMAALRSDLEQVSSLQGQPGQDEPGDESSTSTWSRFDAQQVYHAKLLRRVRFDRVALRVAEAALSLAEESQELLLGPKRMQWLRRFIAEYRETEPDLAAALAQAALGRAFAQEFCDLFNEAVQSFPGPRHDRLNRLLTFFYYVGIGSDASARRTAERALNEYLNHDLPQNGALSAPLRGAIASQIHLNEARTFIEAGRAAGIVDRIFGTPENPRAIRNHLHAAVIADPANSPAYMTHAEWLASKLDDDRLTTSSRTPLENELAEVMQSWSQAAPQEVEPRLWLVDHFLESERLEEARPHVEFLAASRQDDPRVRALPWKWQLLESMRLCRRKAWLAEVPPRLDEAERLWPAWLSKRWLPYLKAAWTLRNGQREAFEEQRRQICLASGLVRDSLPDACLMLGAAQQMRAAATELKPFRAAVDHALDRINTLPIEELLETGSFFWDLHRAQLIYPAYRLHGKTIGKALFGRLAKATRLVLDGIDDEKVLKAVLWGSEYRFWSSNYETKLPPFFSNPTIRRHPFFIAARLNAFLKQRYAWNVETYRELGPALRETSPSQRDAYYRHWFNELADKLDDALASESFRFSGFPFRDLLENGVDDNALECDPDCDCPECQMARKRAEKRTPSSQATLF
jgi:hypothetical protein